MVLATFCHTFQLSGIVATIFSVMLAVLPQALSSEITAAQFILSSLAPHFNCKFSEHRNLLHSIRQGITETSFILYDT